MTGAAAEAGGLGVRLRSSHPSCHGCRRHRLGFCLFLVINFCQSLPPVFAEHLLCAEFKEVSGTQAGSALRAPSWCEAAPPTVRTRTRARTQVRSQN